MQLCGCQTRFLSGLRNTQSFVILSLNHKSADLGNHSLCSLILNIKSQADQSRRVFHTVDLAWNNISTTVFTYFQDVEAEADAIIGSLYLYLINIYPQFSGGITKCLTGGAIEDSKYQKWDAVCQCVVGEDNKALDNLLTIEDDFNLLCIEGPDGLLKRKLDETPMALDMHSQDSMSTFQSRKKPTRTSNSNGNAGRAS